MEVVHAGEVVLRWALVGDGVSVGDLKRALEEELKVPCETQKLIVGGRVMRDDDAVRQYCDASSNVTRVLLIYTDVKSVELVKSMREDRFLKPFEATARPARFVAKPRSTKTPSSISKYGFGDTVPLGGYADSDAAKALLERLANDAGIVKIMQEHHWRVGALKEMEPTGKVGVDPVCVLGFNVNQGAEIHLRLRTDDRRGFRPMHKLIEVLCHELAHNVHGDHNAEFYALMNQLLKEYKQPDWKQHDGRALDSSAHSSAYREAADATGYTIVPEETSGRIRLSPRKLGSSQALQDGPHLSDMSARDATREAALLRFSGQKTATKKKQAGSPKQPPSRKPNNSHATRPESVSLTCASPKSMSNDQDKSDDGITAANLLTHSAPENRGVGGEQPMDDDVEMDERPSGRADGEVAEVVRAAVELVLEECVEDSQREDAVRVALVIVDNAFRHPEEPRYRRINVSNSAFQRALGRWRNSIRLLRTAGFQERELVLELTSYDPARLYIAKSVLEETARDLIRT